MAKTATKLKALLKERGLPAGNATKSTLVDRFLKGKKKAPKTSTERSAASRKTRSQAKKEEDKARNKQQQTSSRANRSEAQKEEDRASNAMGMAALRGDENHRLKENERERLRKKDWRKVPKNRKKEKACLNERRADGTSDLDKIKDLTRGDLSTRLWTCGKGLGLTGTPKTTNSIGRRQCASFICVLELDGTKISIGRLRSFTCTIGW